MFIRDRLMPGTFENNHQFHIAQRSLSVYIEHPDQYQYRYGDGVMVGEDLVEYALQNHEPPVRVLDIGAGKGTFLAAMHQAYGERVELVGINAKDDESELDESVPVRMVVGDFQRPHTWSDKSVHQKESFDVIISTNTFYMFVDPIGAVARAHRMLRPNGQMAIDRLLMSLDPETKQTLLGMIHSFIQGLGGRVNSFKEWGLENEGQFATSAVGLYFHKTEASVLRIPPELELAHHPTEGIIHRFIGPGSELEFGDRLPKRRPMLTLPARPEERPASLTLTQRLLQTLIK